jgi:hypothetical protein
MFASSGREKAPDDGNAGFQNGPGMVGGCVQSTAKAGTRNLHQIKSVGFLQIFGDLNDDCCQNHRLRDNRNGCEESQRNQKGTAGVREMFFRFTSGWGARARQREDGEPAKLPQLGASEAVSAVSCGVGQG